jgi:hypothetical protein
VTIARDHLPQICDPFDARIAAVREIVVLKLVKL